MVSPHFDLPGLPAKGRCLVMGVVNVTPDSFSDGGEWFDRGRAVEHGLRLAAEGADLVDVGGESTRPGAQRVSEEEELRRTAPVVRELARQGVAVSIDTMRARVADQAVQAGAVLVNDVSGGLADPSMARLVAGTGVAYVLMHWRGHSNDMEKRAVYADVAGEVHDELRMRMESVVGEGVDPGQIVLDPGLGFAKRPEHAHNWQLLAHLDRFDDLGRPLLIAGSRKRFLGRLLADAHGADRPFTESDDATLALTALSAAAGAWAVRVHDVRPNADAVRVAAAWQDGGAALKAGRGEPVGSLANGGTAPSSTPRSGQ
ncbi:dihydropteroate synthase [Nocardiopsis composta]|uniref:Dihydropteroate synthase n=1 Tax=Nocardiopsis composta TaxID=157465 RepID=A0A7W8VEJ6_9ACTN|nr:dihydropteroate synthase [Nocardiopsis composta]MBB5433180.1 dihydropteroate synthase [Nocardiopsis composta]